MANSYNKLKGHLNGAYDSLANLEREYLAEVARADELRRENEQLKTDRESLLSTCRAYGDTAKGQNDTLDDMRSENERLRERILNLELVCKVYEDLHPKLVAENERLESEIEAMDRPFTQKADEPDPDEPFKAGDKVVLNELYPENERDMAWLNRMGVQRFGIYTVDRAGAFLFLKGISVPFTPDRFRHYPMRFHISA